MINFKKASKKIIVEMYESFFDAEFPACDIDRLPDEILSPAEVGAVLFRYFSDPSGAIDALLNTTACEDVIKVVKGTSEVEEVEEHSPGTPPEKVEEERVVVKKEEVDTTVIKFPPWMPELQTKLDENPLWKTNVPRVSRYHAIHDVDWACVTDGYDGTLVGVVSRKDVENKRPTDEYFQDIMKPANYMSTYTASQPKLALEFMENFSHRYFPVVYHLHKLLAYVDKESYPKYSKAQNATDIAEETEINLPKRTAREQKILDAHPLLKTPVPMVYVHSKIQDVEWACVTSSSGMVVGIVTKSDIATKKPSDKTFFDIMKSPDCLWARENDITHEQITGILSNYPHRFIPVVDQTVPFAYIDRVSYNITVKDISVEQWDAFEPSDTNYSAC
jgi:CBS domain-containing protein